MTWGFVDESEMRWIEYDAVYEKMWKDMAKTVDGQTQTSKIHEMARYIYEKAYCLFMYSPLALSGVNKEVDFVPARKGVLLLKETSVSEKHWSVRERAIKR